MSKEIDSHFIHKSSATGIFAALVTLMVILGLGGCSESDSKLSTGELAVALADRLENIHRLRLDYADPCVEMTITDTTGKFSTFDIRDSDTQETESVDCASTEVAPGRNNTKAENQWVVEKGPGKYVTVLSTKVKPSYAVDNPVHGSALSLFRQLKAACLVGD